MADSSCSSHHQRALFVVRVPKMRAKSPSSDCSTIASSSPGTPGSETRRCRRARRGRPGRRRWGSRAAPLPPAAAPSCGGSRSSPRTARGPWRGTPRTSRSRAARPRGGARSSTPRPSATPSRVRSSLVGPRPPTVKTSAGRRSRAPRISAAMAATSSRSMTVRRTSPPRPVTRLHSQLVLVSRTSPMSTSLPADTISTMGAPVRGSTAPCVGMKPLMDKSRRRRGARARCRPPRLVPGAPTPLCAAAPGILRGV